MHVGIDDADKAIHVANGMRVHVPVLLALSANSPFWRGQATGLASTRMPIFRQFPRVGMPPALRRTGRTSSERIGFMVDVEDDRGLHLPLVRRPPAPELRHGRDPRRWTRRRASSTRSALAALIQAMVKELAEHFEAGKQLADYPYEMLDENRWIAARHGLDGEMVDLPSYERVPTKALAKRLHDRLAEHAQDLGSAAELEGIEDLLERGNGAHRQQVVYEANHDLHEVVREIAEASVPE